MPKCNNGLIQYAGLADMYNNRMALGKHKEKDYMQSMKKGPQLNAEIKK